MYVPREPYNPLCRVWKIGMNIVLNVIVNAEPIDGCCGASSAEWYTGAVWLGGGKRPASRVAVRIPTQ